MQHEKHVGNRVKKSENAPEKGRGNGAFGLESKARDAAVPIPEKLQGDGVENGVLLEISDAEDIPAAFGSWFERQQPVLEAKVE